MRRLGLAVCAAVILVAIPVSADTIASPPIYGGLSQDKLFCYVYNAGSTAISITAVKGYVESGASGVIPSNCPSQLQPGKSCQGIQRVSTTDAYGCRITLTNKASARGSVEIRDINTHILNRADLR